MKHHLTAAIWLAAFALLGVATLQWSWNTIAPLFDGPLVHFRHALAGLLLLAIAATAFAGTGRRHRRRRQDDHET